MRLKQEQRDFDTVSISTITAGQSLLAQLIALNEPSDRSESLITNQQGSWYMRSSDLILQLWPWLPVISGCFYGIMHSINGVFLVLITDK